MAPKTEHGRAIAAGKERARKARAAELAQMRATMDVCPECRGEAVGGFGVRGARISCWRCGGVGFVARKA